jgi:hypothetical protein
MQGDKACVYVVASLGEPEHDAPPLLANNPVLDIMEVEPPADVAAPADQVRLTAGRENVDELRQLSVREVCRSVGIPVGDGGGQFNVTAAVGE